MTVMELKTLHDTAGNPIHVLEKIGSGGQGVVYRVRYQGREKALKWYTCRFTDPEAFRKNLIRNVKNGSPGPMFLWPQAVTEVKDGSFGYVMDLFPEGYYEFTKYIAQSVQFHSYRAAVTAGIGIITAFRILHARGYAYQDLNNGNFIIHPETGEIRIADNDNVSPDHTNLGIIGKPRWIAPEIVEGDALPETHSDQFSLSVVLFMLLCNTHPFEGKKWAETEMMTKEAVKRIYGYNAVFVCDPKNRTNGRKKGITDNLVIWDALPEYLRALFIKAFSRERIRKPDQRVIESDWLEAFLRFRNEIVPCPKCGNEIFLDDPEKARCEECGKPWNSGYRLIFPKYAVPVTDGAQILRGQLEYCGAADAVQNILTIREDRTGRYRIRNRSRLIWNAVTSHGEHVIVRPEEEIPVKKGIRFCVRNTRIEIQ